MLFIFNHKMYSNFITIFKLKLDYLTINININITINIIES